jgi:ubiquinone/menaquinone biosynthesis C-methylase UbiE
VNDTLSTNQRTNAWYDRFAAFYDAALDGMYAAHRMRAIEALGVAPNMTVVDVGCGTGATLPLLRAAVGENGRVIGVDASAGMLRKAEALVRRRDFHNVELLQVGTEATSIAAIASRVGRVDRVLCFLSLSVIDPWQLVLNGWLDVLPEGGALTIADVHNPRPGPYARLVELIARATLARKSWEPLQQRTTNFQLEWEPSSWFLGGAFFLATGTVDGSQRAY